MNQDQDHERQDSQQIAEPAPAAKTKKFGPRLARARGGNDPNRSPVPPGLDDMADGIFEQGFVATDTKWSNTAKEFLTVPDIKTRLETLKLFLAYRHGMPIQRQIRIEGAFKDRHTEMLEMARTPSGRDLLLKMGVIDADWLKRNLPDLKK